MAPSLGQLIAARAKRDPLFKKKTLTALYKKLSKAKAAAKHFPRTSVVHQLPSIPENKFLKISLSLKICGL